MTKPPSQRKDRASPRYRATYTAWRNMLARCYDKKHQGYPTYGGRGIKVADCWRPEGCGLNGAAHAFANFISFVGLRPTDGHSLDRLDPDQDYRPGNVRWATSLEQGVNKRGTKHVLHPKTGLRIAAATLAREEGITYQQLRYRMLAAGTWYLAEAAKESDTAGLPGDRGEVATDGSDRQPLEGSGANLPSSSNDGQGAK